MMGWPAPCRQHRLLRQEIVMTIKFTEGEIKALEGHPDALRALADWHSVKETEADAIGGPEMADCVSHHAARYDELRAEATKIEADY